MTVQWQVKDSNIIVHIYCLCRSSTPTTSSNCCCSNCFLCPANVKWEGAETLNTHENTIEVVYVKDEGSTHQSTDDFKLPPKFGFDKVYVEKVQYYSTIYILGNLSNMVLF